MVAATLTPTEDATYAALARWICKVLDFPETNPPLVKGFQNQVAAPVGSFIVVSPGLMQRQDFGRRSYDPDAGEYGQAVQEAHNTYSYQVDCYGPMGPVWASILAAAWATMWSVDNITPNVLTPLYADPPQQVNIVNSEGQYEQRMMIRLFAQVNQVVGLPQDFFDQLTLDSITIADQLP